MSITHKSLRFLLNNFQFRLPKDIKFFAAEEVIAWENIYIYAEATTESIQEQRIANVRSYRRPNKYIGAIKWIRKRQAQVAVVFQ